MAQALGFSEDGIKNALRHTKAPYLWATEFENVHSLWKYPEQRIEVDGTSYTCSEDYYHSQKPRPFSDSTWDPIKVQVMEKAVRAKLRADPALIPLLLATHPHPLLSMKPDKVWGFHPNSGGQNLLAQIWMRVRQELILSGSIAPTQ